MTSVFVACGLRCRAHRRTHVKYTEGKTSSDKEGKSGGIIDDDNEDALDKLTDAQKTKMKRRAKPAWAYTKDSKVGGAGVVVVVGRKGKAKDTNTQHHTMIRRVGATAECCVTVFGPPPSLPPSRPHSTCGCLLGWRNPIPYKCGIRASRTLLAGVMEVDCRCNGFKPLLMPWTFTHHTILQTMARTQGL